MMLRLVTIAISATAVFCFNPHSLSPSPSSAVTASSRILRNARFRCQGPTCSAGFERSTTVLSMARSHSRKSSFLRRKRLGYQILKGNLLKLNERMRLNCWSTLKRAMISMLFIATLWCSSARISTPPAHASASTNTMTLKERVLNVATGGSSTAVASSSFDNVVDQYVKQHMFEDDSYDAVESLYRESHHDATVGSYPNALREATASVLGEQRGLGNLLSEASEPSNLLVSVVNTLQKRFGLSTAGASIVIAVVGLILLPYAAVFAFFTFGSISKRNLNKTFKKRYGEDYTVDATIKTEEEVEAPDDDEDEDDEDDDDDE
mmetsp:Transcript_13242/g.30132  ORF Transcript_13242/g.30132 Transcript_13242/m.30132 type:complete len:321 (+) Transcript_13242:44-1006(+)|eukprot:CAMPEP_0168732498 /NCGR_PEP_ID=MMETSP0724-20121128/7802_1 /TAXON_ID=265536 /ORGANISM="Amphiprora sp., Strain CCMP467" /LENGTH=320 /DNA_ID=CAMNT_0008779519 /DNA_START=40 /DNA_END=1002 /DNA_ORIENTATION=-